MQARRVAHNPCLLLNLWPLIYSFRFLWMHIAYTLIVRRRPDGSLRALQAHLAVFFDWSSFVPVSDLRSCTWEVRGRTRPSTEHDSDKAASYLRTKLPTASPFACVGNDSCSAVSIKDIRTAGTASSTLRVRVGEPTLPMTHGI